MDKKYKTLVINPGSTSTKISIFHGLDEVFTENVNHWWGELDNIGLFDQAPLRKTMIIEALEKAGYDICNLNAIVCRGAALVNPLKVGIYRINDSILRDAIRGSRNHASSVGPAISNLLSAEYGIKAYMISLISGGEHWELAKFSGLKGFIRDPFFHIENQKAVGSVAARKLGKTYDEVTLIVAHLGGGISVCLHHKGKCVDSTSANKSTGPFTGRRAGGISPWHMLDICFSENMTREKVDDLLMNNGGLLSYLGTDDGREIEKRIVTGDEYAALVYEAMAYRIAKEIGSYAPAIYGKVDAICLTGGMAYSKMLTNWIKERCSFIAPIMVFPGSLEQEIINEYMQKVLSGNAEAYIYE